MKIEHYIEGVIYDPVGRLKIPGRIFVENERISKIERDENIRGPYILPGFVDSHIHIESSMLQPVEFSRIAKVHGTIAVVADPHEIANVAGMEGINYMINNSRKAEIKFYFGAPSCVPASPFDDCKEILDSDKIEILLSRDDIYFLGEMMNYPGVINDDPDVLRKIEFAKKYKKPIDGHAPGLSQESLTKYINAGITTDHECFTLEEAIEKISKGMKVLIREGSAAKNFNSLSSLIDNYPMDTMVCTDDCHPEDLMVGHINNLVKRSLILGYDIFNILQVVSVNPIKHYGLEVGLLQVGDYADFIVIDDLKNFNIIASYIKGNNILEIETDASIVDIHLKGDFSFTKKIELNDLSLFAQSQKLKAIKALDGELVTEEIVYKIRTDGNSVISDIENDILKVVVVNRYKENEVAVGFIKGFGLKIGAIAESIAHDSHHIIAVGVNDSSIYKSLNYIIDNKGGLCYFDGYNILGLTLPIYGLISDKPANIVAEKYNEINKRVINDGCVLRAPFMTLSFMALSVIPKLKITPRGLFDVQQFNFIDQFI